MKFGRWINKIINERQTTVSLDKLVEVILRNKLCYTIDDRVLRIIDKSIDDPDGEYSHADLYIDVSDVVNSRVFWKINRKGQVVIDTCLCGFFALATTKICRVLSVYQRRETVNAPERIIRLDAPAWVTYASDYEDDKVSYLTRPMFISEAKTYVDKYVAGQYAKIHKMEGK